MKFILIQYSIIKIYSKYIIAKIAQNAILEELKFKNFLGSMLLDPLA